MLTISLDDALAARVQAALPSAKIADANAFAVAAINAALARLEQSEPQRGKPLAQFVDEQRAKHGFAPEWGTKDVVLTPEQWQRIDAAFADTK